jgi:hypothetical protein
MFKKIGLLTSKSFFSLNCYLRYPSEININDVPVADPTKIADHFNTFFTSIGKKIANGVQNVAVQPEDYKLWSGYTESSAGKYHE